MGSRLAMGMLALCACHGAHLGEGSPDSQTKIDGAIDSPMIDGAPDALPAWSAPVIVPGAGTSTLNIDDETLNSTQTELYFGIVDATLGVKQLWMMSRASAADTWGTPVKMDATFNIVTTPATQEESPRLSPDDLTLYFGRGGDIYYAQRGTVGGAWSNPQILSGVSTTANYEKWFAVCQGGYYMVARDTGSGTPFHLYAGQLNAGPDAEATELADVTGSETSTFLSADCMTTYFASSRVSPTGIYSATRSNPTAKWVGVHMVTDFGTTYEQEDPWMSNDGLVFYFASQRYGSTNTNKGVYCSSR